MMKRGEKYTFCHDELRNCCFTRFRDMKNKKEFCDITIKFGNHSITAHRLVLASAIPYFTEILGLPERGSGRPEISMDQIDPESLKSLIEYAYTSKVEITSHNANNLFSAARILKMNEVQDACCSFMAEQLNPENALSTRELADSFGCLRLLENVDNYICRNFDEVAKTQEFLNSSFACVEKITNRIDLYSKGKIFLEFAIKWVKVSPEERKSYLPQLLNKFKMAFVRPRSRFLYLRERLIDEDIILSPVEWRDIEDYARNYRLFPDKRSEISNIETKPRFGGTRKVKSNDPLITGIYAVSQSTMLRIQRFDPKTEEWSTQKTFSSQSKFQHGALAVSSDCLYYTDGCDLKSCTSMTGDWKFKGQLGSVKHNFGAVVLNDMLFVCGGDDGEFIRDYYLESYNLETDKFLCVAPVPIARNFLGVVVLGKNIYVLGGCKGDVVYDLVDKYDLKKGKFISLSPMLTRRCGVGCTTVNRKIYVCGGSRTIDDDDSYEAGLLASAEVYDVLNNKWSYISSIGVPRLSCSLSAYSGKLYAVGGYGQDLEPVNTVEIYDPKSDAWKFGPPFSVEMGFVQAAAVSSCDT